MTRCRIAYTSPRWPAVARTLACALTPLLVAALALGPPPAAAASGAGTRVTVALFGDSVTESLLVPNFLQEGLAPQLSRSLSSLGYAPGGAGLIPAVPYRWHFGKWVSAGSGPLPANGWLALGYGVNSPGLEGPSGYSAVTASPSATATAAVSDPDVEVLYTSTTLPCQFDVTAAGQSWTIDTFRSGPAVDTATTLHLPAGRHELTIHGPSCGLLTFDGVVAQRPPAAGQVQVEVDNLGHSGALPSANFGPGVQQSISDQRYDITVFLYGYIGEVVGGGKSLSGPYLSSMMTRAHIAREHGGACLIVAPTPIAATAATVTQVANLDRTVARRAHCTYTTVLTHLWSSPAAAERQGLVLIDGIHPTAAGYKLITQVLAPVVATLVRAHLHH